MNTQPVFNAMPMVLLCSFHLLSGLAIGLLLGVVLAKLIRKRESDEGEAATFYRTAFERLSLQAGAVKTVADAQHPPVAAPVLAAVQALSETSSDLQQRAKQIQKQRRNSPNTRRKHSHSISRGEMRSLISASQTGIEMQQNGKELERHPFQVLQWMGRCQGNRLPAVVEFEKVMCQDISVNGVSFYADDVHIGQQVVMIIGTNDRPMYMVAEALHRRVIERGDRLTYLVGFRFKRRLIQESDGKMLEEYQQLLSCEPALSAGA